MSSAASAASLNINAPSVLIVGVSAVTIVNTENGPVAPKNSDVGLSTSGIVGVSIGSVVAVALIVLVLVVQHRRRKFGVHISYPNPYFC